MIAKKIEEKAKTSQWIRAMFEEGAKLKSIYGEKNVYDFTLGNPFLSPPDSVKDIIVRLVSDKETSIHKYMNNAGFEDVKAKIAEHISRNSKHKLVSKNIIMTVGAAGALNVILKTILDPGDEVMVLAPYFVEYLFYIDNHGGVPVIINNESSTFDLNLAEISNRITKNTKAIIVNSPNNPSGAIYSHESLLALSEILSKKEKEFNSTIYIISDEPYRELVYDNVQIPNIMNLYTHSIIVYSYSKSLSLAGERIGYIAVNNSMENVSLLTDALTFCNRILGFVNAPSLFQKVVAELLDESIDVSHYKEKRDFLYEELTSIGYKCHKPEGAFYLFPQSLEPNDVSFVKKALSHNLLFVPGTGFGCPGYFRISYSVDMETIQNSIPSFKKLYNDY